MPWTGFFHKMSMANLYVLLDHVQYRKSNYQNRNRLIDVNGNVYWCTVPLRAGGHEQKINEKEIVEGKWHQKYLNKIADSYRKCEYFNHYFDDIAAIISKKHRRLVDLNLDLIHWFRRQLGIEVEMILSSSLKTHGVKSELNLDICKQLNASTYISGPSGRDYLDLSRFRECGIDVVFHQFSPPVYSAKNFEPGLSTLDLLMNHGEDSAYIMGIGATQ